MSKPASPLLSEAKTIYLKAKGRGKASTFAGAVERAVDYLTQSKGDKALLSYKRADATSFRDELFDRGLAGSSVVRVLATLKAIFRFVLSEAGISEPSAFVGIYVDRTLGVEERLPFTQSELQLVGRLCKEADDDVRWLVALISDTGMRLAEAAGLALEDINTDAEIPHIIIRAHPWRSLKTKASERTIPLVGLSLWGAQRIKSSVKGSFAFPRYTKDGHTNANSASASLNKWLSAQVSKTSVVHSFRHSLRDRLRAVECPSELADEIGGWAKPSVGQRYGTGHSLELMHHWLAKIELE